MIFDRVGFGMLDVMCFTDTKGNVIVEVRS